MKKNSGNYLKILSIILLWLAIGGLIGCDGAEITYKDKEDDEEITGTLTVFTSNEELVAYLKDQYSKNIYSDYDYALTERTSANAGGDSPSGAFESGESSYSSQSSEDAGNYTGTNLQEAGVDESDLLKTDGEYLYIAGNDSVTVVRATNPLEVMSVINVNGTVDSMYLYNTDADIKLLVLLYAPLDYEGVSWLDPGEIDAATLGLAYWIPVQAKTGVAFYDITDSSTPEEIKTVEADGYLVSSRRIENRLHIVQQFLPDLPSPYTLEDEIDDMTLEELMPFYSEPRGASGEDQKIQLVAPEDFYHPSIDGGGSIVTILTFDLDNLESPFSSTGVVADASIVYASTEALYCTSTYWKYSDASEQALEQTIIYKFDLAGDQVTGQGYTSVNGRVLNQFSLGEYEGVLRLATTTGWSWGTDTNSKNHVYCLRSQDGELKVIGSLEGLAPGEELYSARFIGPRGYLVTFVNIDPLFTLDLSDPTAPQVIGELKVPGYSSYIHPWGDNYLVTVGKDAIELDGFAWYQGVQLSIFDIRDFAKPQLLHKAVLGDRGTTSEALYNHKAFTFWEAEGLMALPIDLYEHQSEPEYPYTYGEFTFKGLYVYRVGIDDGFEFIGRISTSSDLEEYGYYYNDWTRGVFIVDNIYAVTPEVVKSAKINDIEGIVQSIAIGSDQDF